MKNHLVLTLLKLLPRNLISRLVGRAVSWNLPFPLDRISVSLFAKHFRINLSEAEKKPEEYKNIQSLFTRKLKLGVRPIQSSLVHCADSRITSFGKIQSNELIQAKGITYPLSELIGENADRFLGGHYITYYLCPTDYHRVHSPCDWDVEKVRFIPGDLWPVSDWSVVKVPKLFAINERVVAVGKTGLGQDVALVMVGATNVGKITLNFVEGQSNTSGVYKEITLTPASQVGVGEEFGVFHMGSTVVLILGPGHRLNEIKSGPVKLGEALGPKGVSNELTH